MPCRKAHGERYPDWQPICSRKQTKPHRIPATTREAVNGGSLKFREQFESLSNNWPVREIFSLTIRVRVPAGTPRICPQGVVTSLQERWIGDL